MVNTFALVISIFLLLTALYICYPDKCNIETVTANTNIAKIWMMASAIVLAMGYLLGK